MRSNAVTYPLVRQRAWSVQVPAERVTMRSVQHTLLFLALHLPLGFAIKADPWIATTHALATMLAAFVVVAEARTPVRLVPILGYIVASEPLWRVGKAMVFYETAKYLIAALALFGVFRFARVNRLVMMPVIYFALLVPSIFVMPHFDRTDVSFNLSGPLSLALATLFLRRVPLSLGVLRTTFTALMGPIVALLVVATFSTLTTENIDFYQTKVASGGLGQNQASSLFGFGALVAFLYLGLLRRNRVLSWVFGLLGLWSAGQAALTFSRGGIATTVGAAAAATFFLSMDRRFRGAVVIRVLLVLLIAPLFVVPVLDSFTGGQLTNRFTSSDLTGRDKIIEADLSVFKENLFLGVGPGQSYDQHARTFRASSAHTEYSRLLAEHGILGAVALCLLLFMGARWVLQQPDARSRSFSAALVVWSLLFMFHAAMRMALVSFVFALAATWLTDNVPRSRPRNAVPPGIRPIGRNAVPPGIRPIG